MIFLNAFHLVSNDRTLIRIIDFVTCFGRVGFPVSCGTVEEQLTRLWLTPCIYATKGLLLVCQWLKCRSRRHRRNKLSCRRWESLVGIVWVKTSIPPLILLQEGAVFRTPNCLLVIWVGLNFSWLIIVYCFPSGWRGISDSNMFLVRF